MYYLIGFHIKQLEYRHEITSIFIKGYLNKMPSKKLIESKINKKYPDIVNMKILSITKFTIKEYNDFII